MGQQSEDDPQWKDEEQQIFEPLCERLLCAVSLLQTSLSEMLDLKDELMAHSLPSSLTTRLSIASGRLFRSVSDLSVPSMELVRLVQVHSTPWEQKKKILEKLHLDNERKQNYLSVALRRLQLLEAQSHSIGRYQRIGNWERLFTRLMGAQVVGRRWRLRVEALKRTAVSTEMPELMVQSPRDPQEADVKDQHQESEGDVVSAVRNSPRKSDHEGVKSEEDMEEPRQGSADSRATSQSSISEGGNAPIFIETQETGAQTEVQTEDKETWTGESLIYRFLCVSVSPVLGNSGKGFSCRLTFGTQTHHVQLTTTPLPKPPKPLPFTKQITIQEKGTVLAARKTSPGALARGVGTPNRATPAGILRRGALSPHREATFDVRSDEVKFEVPTSSGLVGDAILDLALYHETEGIVATGQLRIPRDASDALTLNVPFIGAGVRTHSPLASLVLNLRFQEEELPRFRDQLTQAWSVHELVREATGIDLQLTSLQELQRLLQPSPEVLEASTSPFPGPAGPPCQDSSTSPMPGPSHSMSLEDVPNPTMDYQQGQHRLQEMVEKLSLLQNIPERDFQMLLDTFTPSTSIPEDAELLPSLSQIRADGNSQNDDASKRHWIEEPSVPLVETELSKPTEETARSHRQRKHAKDVSRSLLLRKALPMDVWQRMKYLQDIMQKNKQNALDKLRSASSESLERQLSSQRRIQAPPEQDTGSQDDVCLPALYMPTKLGHLFTPKAHLYFHPSGSGSTLRLTQPPSVLSLPPLSAQNKLSVLNLLEPSVTLPSFQGQRRSGKKIKGVPPEGKEDPSAPSKDIQEISKTKDLTEHFVGVALEATESFYSLNKDTEENPAKVVADVSESRETVSILGNNSEKTLDGKELIEKVALDRPKLTEGLSTEEKGIGEIRVGEQLLENVV